MPRKKRRGFKGMYMIEGGDSMSTLRQQIRQDIDDALESVDDEEKEKGNKLSETLKAFSSIQAWQTMNQAQQNIQNRLMRLSTFVDQTGPNAGRIVIPANWDTKARTLMAELVEGYVGLSVDTYNALSADRAITLWGFLANGLDMGGLGDSVFGVILLLQFTGNGLGTGSFLGMPSQNMQGTILVPRLLAMNLALAA